MYLSKFLILASCAPAHLAQADVCTEGVCKDAIATSAMLQVQQGTKGGHRQKSAGTHQFIQDATQLGAPDGSATHCVPIQDTTPASHLRIRQEIFDVPLDKWNKFKEAWRALQADGTYDNFAWDHTMRYGYYKGKKDLTAKELKKKYGMKSQSKDGWKLPPNEPMRPGVADTMYHHGANFLPYHRSLLAELETAIQKQAQDCTLTIPYWNWALEVGNNVLNSNIWNDTYMGNSGGGCVTTGLPAGWNFPNNNGKCVTRHSDQLQAQFGSATPELGATIQTLQTILAQNNWKNKFSKELEAVHNVAHCGITGFGSNFCNGVGKSSPSDPMFFIHHAFIDSLWFRWQQMRPTKSTSCHGCSNEMKKWATMYDTDGQCVFSYVSESTADVGTQTSVCLQYAEPSALSAATSATTAVGLLQHGQVSQRTNCEKMEKWIELNLCTDVEIQNIPCVNTAACTRSVEDLIKANNGFDDNSASQVDEAAVFHTLFDNQCKSVVDSPSAEEEKVCMGCDASCAMGALFDQYIQDESQPEEECDQLKFNLYNAFMTGTTIADTDTAEYYSDYSSDGDTADTADGDYSGGDSSGGDYSGGDSSETEDSSDTDYP